MNYNTRIELELVAAKGRRSALGMVQAARSGHLGGSLSVMDILTVLYFDKMRIDPANPHDANRDRTRYWPCAVSSQWRISPPSATLIPTCRVMLR